jgi:serine/threonine-protein kinase RsbW
MQLTMALCLPRDEGTVGLARRALASSLAQLGVTPDCIHDIELGVSEACTNVIRHGEPGVEYEVSLEVEDDLAVMRIVDTGASVDWQEQSERSPGPSAEHGRGIAIMEALMDSLHFEVKPESGTVVHLEKALEFTAGSLLRRTRGH